VSEKRTEQASKRGSQKSERLPGESHLCHQIGILRLQTSPTKLVRGVGFGPQFTSTYKQIPQKKFRQGLVVLLGYVIACGHLFDSRKAPKHR